MELLQGAIGLMAMKPIHPPDAIKENLDPSKHLGPLIPSTLPVEEPAPAPVPPPTSVPVGQTTNQNGASAIEEFVKPSLAEILSLHDFEAVARRTMSKRGWNYYSS